MRYALLLLVTLAHASSECPPDGPGTVRSLWNGVRGNIRETIASTGGKKWLLVEYVMPNKQVHRARILATVDEDQVISQSLLPKTSHETIRTRFMPLASIKRAEIIGDGSAPMTLAEIQSRMPKGGFVRVTNIYGETFQGAPISLGGPKPKLRLLTDPACATLKVCTDLKSDYIPAEKIIKIQVITSEEFKNKLARPILPWTPTLRALTAHSSSPHEFKQGSQMFVGQVIMDADGTPLLTVQNGVEHIEIINESGVVKLFPTSKLGKEVTVSRQPSSKP